MIASSRAKPPPSRHAEQGADSMTQAAITERLGETGSRLAVTLLEGGATRRIEGYPGETLLIALKRADLPLAAICGGKGACGTCRVHVPAAWRDRLPMALKRELRLLDFTDAADGDRLSCRIQLVAELNGLEIHACTAIKGDA